MRRAALAALLSHWRRHPAQLATLILGLALATALWSGVQAINAEARASYARAAEAIGGGGLDALVVPGGTIAEATYVALRRTGWQVSPVVEGGLLAEGGRARLVGLDPLTAPRGTDAAALALDDPAKFFAPPGIILAAPATALRLTGPGLPPVIAADGLAPGLAFTDIGTAQRLLGMEGQLSRLIVLPDQPRVLPPLAGVAPNLERQRPDSGEGLARLTDSFHLNLTAFGLLSFAVGLFIVHGAVGMAFEQRRPVFRTLRALGVPARTLVGLLAAELAILAAVAALIGIAMGYVIAAALLPNVAATLRGLYGAAVEGTLTLRPAWWAAGLAIALAGTAVASAGSLWKVSRLPALAPAQPRAWARASERAILGQAIAALALAALALGLMTWASGLLAGFVMLGALLVAAALLLPLYLWGALSLLARTARGPVSQWFWADTRQQLPGLSLALMALLLALATNIGVGTMVSSFRLTFTGWLDQRLASELYVTADDDAQARAMLAWLEPRTDAILPIWSVDVDVLGAPGEIFGVADHPTYRQNWPILDALPDAWDQVATGDAALVNEQLARRAGLALGDPIALPGWQATVAGVYSDYGNTVGQVLVAPDRLTRQFPDVERLRYGIRIAPDRIPDLVKGLVDEVGVDPDNMIDQTAIKQFSLDVFERTFTVTAALNIMTLAVAGFAILTSLLTLATMRLPQLAPVWALGLTRARLARLELLRACLLAALTLVAAVPAGLMLAWVLLTVINVEAFGWLLPMHLFPGQWAALGALAIVAAALASLWPALRLLRMPPATLLKVFASER